MATDSSFIQKNKFRFYPLSYTPLIRQQLSIEAIMTLNALLKGASFNIYATQYGEITNTLLDNVKFPSLRGNHYLYTPFTFPVIRLNSILYTTIGTEDSYDLSCSLVDITDTTKTIGNFLIKIAVSSALEDATVDIDPSSFETVTGKRIPIDNIIYGTIVLGDFTRVNPLLFNEINCYLVTHPITFQYTTVTWYLNHYVTSIQPYNLDRLRPHATSSNRMTYWSFIDLMYELKENVSVHSFIYNKGVLNLVGGLNCKLTGDAITNTITIEASLGYGVEDALKTNSTTGTKYTTNRATIKHAPLGLFYQESTDSYEKEPSKLGDSNQDTGYNGDSQGHSIKNINGAIGPEIKIVAEGINIEYGISTVNISLNKTKTGCNK